MNRRSAILVCLWALAAYASWRFLGNYWAPDSCLDVEHGSFDYALWTCSLTENKTFIETPIFAVPGFALALVAFMVALLSQVLWRQRRPHSKTEP